MEQRVIKFRAWDKVHSAMLPCVPIEAVQAGRWLEMTATTLTIMQFTGLHDMNGKEIYEGDILTDSLGKSYQVEFKNGCFEMNNDDVAWDLDVHTGTFPSVVVGNVFENAELLKSAA